MKKNTRIRGFPAPAGRLLLRRIYDPRQDRRTRQSLRLPAALHGRGGGHRLGQGHQGRLRLQRQGRTARGGLPEHRQATALRPFLPGKRPHQRRRRTLRTGRHRRTGHAVERHPAGVRRKRSPPWKRSSPRPATTCSATACARSTQADVRRRGDEPRQYLRRDHVPEQRLRLPFARGGDGADRALPPPSGSSAAN